MSSGGFRTTHYQNIKMNIESTDLQNSTNPKLHSPIYYAQVFSRLYLGDCLIESDKIENGSVDLILTDLPYGNMNTDGGRKLRINGWDFIIEPKQVYEIANRILRKNGKMVLFSQEPYTTQLINEEYQTCLLITVLFGKKIILLWLWEQIKIWLGFMKIF